MPGRAARFCNLACRIHTKLDNADALWAHEPSLGTRVHFGSSSLASSFGLSFVLRLVFLGGSLRLCVLHLVVGLEGGFAGIDGGLGLVSWAPRGREALHCIRVDAFHSTQDRSIHVVAEVGEQPLDCHRPDTVQASLFDYGAYSLVQRLLRDLDTLADLLP